MRRARVVGLVAFAMYAASMPAIAEDYPARPVPIIVPFAPAGSADIVARLVGQKLSERLGKPVVGENRPGGATTAGAAAAPQAAPDGHTLMLSPGGTLAINPTVFKKLPYDPLKDFTPVALTTIVPLMLVVNPAVPAHSVADFLRLANDKPGELSYASAGAGSSLHLAAEMFRSMTGIAWTHVPYKGGAPAISDVIGGHVTAMFIDTGVALPHVRDGKVRALGVSSTIRLPAAPDIPPIAETVPGYDAASWQMAVVPAGTPPEIVDRLHREFVIVMALPEVRERMGQIGLIAATSPPPDELKRYLASEIARWGEIVRQAGLA